MTTAADCVPMPGECPVFDEFVDAQLGYHDDWIQYEFERIYEVVTANYEFADAKVASQEWRSLIARCREGYWQDWSGQGMDDEEEPSEEDLAKEEFADYYPPTEEDVQSPDEMDEVERLAVRNTFLQFQMEQKREELGQVQEELEHAKCELETERNFRETIQGQKVCPKCGDAYDRWYRS